jgi:hypothetical protein
MSADGRDVSGLPGGCCDGAPSCAPGSIQSAWLDDQDSNHPLRNSRAVYGADSVNGKDDKRGTTMEDKKHIYTLFFSYLGDEQKILVISSDIPLTEEEIYKALPNPGGNLDLIASDAKVITVRESASEITEQARQLDSLFEEEAEAEEELWASPLLESMETAPTDMTALLKFFNNLIKENGPSGKREGA